ncbi:MAG: enhanced serine sensitivity protein SseB [Lachnospiraceae bacterium]|nr:enhanced serine sensitivity protein SseB [Lachnospiraceae bacterium]
MGFFNQIFSRNKKTENEFPAEQGKKEECSQSENTSLEDASPQQEKEEGEYYTLMVEQIFASKKQEVIAAGILRGAKAREQDSVFVMKRGNQVLESKIMIIDNPKVGKMKEAPAGAPIAVTLSGIEPKQIQMGDIITNQLPNTTDLKQSITNPRIKGLMGQAAAGPTEELMNLIYEEFAMNARFIAAMLLSKEPEIDQEGKAQFQEGTTMQLPLLTAPAGSKYYPAFTDMQELVKWEEMRDAKTILLSFDDYVSMVLQNEETSGIVVNPFSENMVVEKELIKHLKQKKELLVQGMTTQRYHAKDADYVVDAAEFPVDMAKAVTKVLEEESAVQKAWLRLMKQNQALNYLLIVDISDMEQRERIFEKIAQVVRPYLNGMLLNIIVYQSDFGKRAAKAAEAFYKKE